MGSRVLVTGGQASIGRYILDALQDMGEPAVGYTDVLSQSATARAAFRELSDLPRLLRIMTEGGVQDVVYAADAADPQLSIEMPVAAVTASVEGVLHLLEAARIAGVRGRIVLLSSTAVYGNRPGRIDEAAPLRPRTPYAVSKVTGEQLGRVYAELYGLDIVALRLGHVYGPELTPPPILASILDAASDGAPFRSDGGADHPFHLTHGEDVARAVLAALRAPKPGERTYNITGGERRTLAELMPLVDELFPNSTIEIGPGTLPNLECQGNLDIGAADRELGYRPLWGAARGLDDYAEWLLAQRDAA